ncbi:mandelate racemase/muconate lactonizing enzyme family protein [Candidatus Bathyarchaeota archaeon]|nr:mandelate racemase/muconate lactonizing enzyme family protein [Candidatus Bathyarchaeota archaeon]
MRINKVEFSPVKVPFVSSMDVLNRGENSLASIPKIIIKVHTDEGIVGIGESYRGISEENVQRASQILIGRDPFEMNFQELGMPYGLDHLFEQAILDIVGKALGMPVYKLLGGAYRKEVPVSAWSPYHGENNPEKVASIAKMAADKGYNVIKLKAYGQVVETVDAIQKAVGPEMAIVLDPNTGFRYPSVTIKLARKLEGYNIVCLEDPVPKANLDWYVLLRQKIDIPLALHISGTDIINAVRKGACDIINTGGTMYEFKKNAAMAELAGIPVWHGSGNDLGILEASYLHACAATKNATLTSDIFGEFCRVDDLFEEPIYIEKGMARVPQKPGLGVELDERSLQRYKAGNTKIVA